MANKIKVLDFEITKEKFPALFSWAQKDLLSLEETILSISVADGGTRNGLISVAINLENDLSSNS